MFRLAEQRPTLYKLLTPAWYPKVQALSRHTCRQTAFQKLFLHSWALKTCKFVKIPRSILQNHNISSYRVYVKKCTFDRIINMITNVCTQNYKYGDDDNFLDVI